MYSGGDEVPTPSTGGDEVPTPSSGRDEVPTFLGNHPLVVFFVALLRTIFSMPQFLTIRTFELPAKEYPSFCYTGILFTWFLATFAFKTTLEPIFPLMTNISLFKWRTYI
jgi:hypothetical protein